MNNKSVKIIALLALSFISPSFAMQQQQQPQSKLSYLVSLAKKCMGYGPKAAQQKSFVSSLSSYFGINRLTNLFKTQPANLTCRNHYEAELAQAELAQIENEQNSMAEQFIINNNKTRLLKREVLKQKMELLKKQRQIIKNNSDRAPYFAKKLLENIVQSQLLLENEKRFDRDEFKKFLSKNDRAFDNTQPLITL